MVSKQFTLGLIAISFILLMSVNVFAITASIGNSRMILRLETGETIEKFILVRNTNDERVTVDLSATGELADRVSLDEESFTLEAGEEKNAYFTISALEEGTYETKINVRYSPQEGGNGVGLTSTIIVIASGEPVVDDLSEQDSNEGFLGFLSNSNTEDEGEGESSISVDTIMLFSTIVLVVALGGMYFYSQHKSKKKSVGRKVDA